MASTLPSLLGLQLDTELPAGLAQQLAHLVISHGVLNYDFQNPDY